MSCALVLTQQIVVDLSLEAVNDYRTLREEQGMDHEEAVEQILAQAAESYICLAGECNH
jgi:translation initiation factor 2 alpha subunit (eIF-2alpha)